MGKRKWKRTVERRRRGWEDTILIVERRRRKRVGELELVRSGSKRGEVVGCLELVKWSSGAGCKVRGVL
jgi:hypothetical protein